jgi:phosphonate transport system permease protein
MSRIAPGEVGDEAVGAPRLVGGRYLEPRFRLLSREGLTRVAVLSVILAMLAASFVIAQVDPARLVVGIPRLLSWMADAWPPTVAELDLMLYRALETVAIATAGTATAALLALPVSILASRNLVPQSVIYYPARLFLNVFRGVDTVIFALLFVVAVGLGPFAGMLGMVLHTIGVIGKLNSEAIETLPRGPIDAARITGAGQTKVVVFTVLPAALPNLASTSLYMWEANVRVSTVLGLVGAGGIGMEIKNSIDILNFSRLFTLTVIVLAMVTIIDALSSWLRRRLG